MSEVAIRIEKLGKAYRIARTAQEGRRYKTLREDLIAAPRALLVRLRGNSESQSTLWALKDISLEINEGEVLGIVGRNGAGKSTLLKVLSRITEPTEGRVELFGRVGSLLEVGTGFHPELTGRENIFLNGTILGMRRSEVARKFDEIVDFAEMAQFLEVPVKRYSSGMYMRLAFAVAAHLEPEILLVDEVLAVGDAEFQKKCLGKIKEVGRSGRTVLFVSHNMNAVERLCTRAILLKRGQVKAMSQDVRSVIKEHLFSDDAEQGDCEWRNTGDDCGSVWFKPWHFWVADEHGRRKAMPAPNNSEIWLHVEGEVEQTDPAFNIGYAVYSEEGHLLYWSFTTDTNPRTWPQIKKGAITLKTRVPSRFLNEGIYRIELLASLHYRKWLLEPGVNAPSIFLSVQGGLSDSPLWMVKRPGQMAPVIEWFSETAP